LQFFISDIIAAVFVPLVKMKLKTSASEGTLYDWGQYKPISNEGPKEYVFVLVNRIDDKITETYYTKRTDRIRVTHIDGKWQETDNIRYSTFAFIAFPLFAFCFFTAGIFHKSARAGSFSTWKMLDYHDDRFENLSKLYWWTFFAGYMIFSLLGRA
jgi:hypothetical protein